jgi:hypothetical protein
MRRNPQSIVLGAALLGAAFLVGELAAQQTPPPAAAPQAQSAQAPRRPASPPGTAAAQVGGKWTTATPGTAPRYSDGKWVEVVYARPILRNRPNIFGSGADYGKTVNSGSPVWRAGANQTTRFKTETPLVFDGKTLPAGEYSLFVELKPKAWTLVLSKQPAQEKYDPSNKTETWGSANYDPAHDVLRAPMTVSELPYSVEQFTIGFVDMTEQGGKLAMWWEKTMAAVPFTVAR